MTSICTGRSSVSDPMCTLPALCGRPVSCASIAQAQPENCPWGEELRDEEWRGLDDEALERLLIERWLYRGAMRSEEHTSELQSRLHLVCRLLLEKKKKKHDAK